MSKERFGRLLILLMIAFVCESCNTCWQCTEKKKDEISIGQRTEELLEVRFESTNGRDLFFNAMCERQRRIKKVPISKGLSLYFPHTTFWNKGDIEIDSQNTVVNEHIRSCDTDDNMLITDNEAKIYNE